MSVNCFSAVVAVPGTPQRLIASTSPAQPTISSGGVTSVAGGGGVAASFASLQAAPTNTAAKSIYIGGPGMSVSGKTGIGMVLGVGAIGQIDFSNGEFSLDDLWIDTDSASAATEHVYVLLVG